MSSTSISGVLFVLLIILQTPTPVSPLPTSSTTTITSSRLETRLASDSNRNNNDNSRGNGNNNSNNNNNNVVHPDNTTTSKFAPPPYQAVTPPIREFAIQAMPSQFNKRDNSEDQKHDSHGRSPGEILGIVIAALTLLVGIIPLFRCSRFHHCVSSSSTPPTVKKALNIKLPSPLSTALGDQGAISAPMPHSDFTVNNSCNYHLVGTCSDTFPRSRDGIHGEDGRVQPVKKFQPSRRLKRAVTCPLPSGLAMELGAVGYSHGQTFPL